MHILGYRERKVNGRSMHGRQNLNIIHWSVTFSSRSHSILKLFKAFTKCYIRCTSSSPIVKILSVSRRSQMVKIISNIINCKYSEVVEDLNLIIPNSGPCKVCTYPIWLGVKCNALQNQQKHFLVQKTWRVMPF